MLKWASTRRQISNEQVADASAAHSTRQSRHLVPVESPFLQASPDAGLRPLDKEDYSLEILALTSGETRDWAQSTEVTVEAKRRLHQAKDKGRDCLPKHHAIDEPRDCFGAPSVSNDSCRASVCAAAKWQQR